MHPLSVTAPGAVYLGDNRCQFSVWAPRAHRVDVHVLSPDDRMIELAPEAFGMFVAEAGGIVPGTEYLLRIDGTDELPDPASRCQPAGVHGPSEVVDAHFAWREPRLGVPAPDDLILYELHVGVFSEPGTFDGAIEHLDALAELGITAIELCPIAEFPGGRNWGYDGVFAYAAQSTYGGPRGLARLVDACHARGIAVFLDVVYNHLGPEGNVLARFGPYFTDRYHTPWGDAINFDGPGADQVRAYFIESALYYLTELRIDGFRVDAIHAINDRSAVPFLAELTQAIHHRAAKLGQRTMVIAESDLGDPRVFAPPEMFGFGMDAQWADDFHHAVHALITGERAGYYADFGKLSDIARAYENGFVFTGQRSQFRGRRHGRAPGLADGDRFVVCTQNHDQVGNRARGDRLAASITPAKDRLAACALLCAPYIPLLFMGQEYGEQASFPYFTGHTDLTLGRAVREGRRREFEKFGWQPEDIPDPQDPGTFTKAKLDPSRGDTPQGRGMRALYTELLRLRRTRPALGALDRFATRADVDEAAEAVIVYRQAGDESCVCVLVFGDREVEVDVAFGPGTWRLELDSEDPRWRGERSGAAEAETIPEGKRRIVRPPCSCAIYSATMPGSLHR